MKICPMAENSVLVLLKLDCAFMIICNVLTLEDIA